MFDLPIRVDIATGERLPATGLDPYALSWVQGAAQTVPRQTRLAYPGQITDLHEKLALLKSRGTVEPSPDTEEFIPDTGPRRRPAGYHGMDQRPLPSDGRVLYGWSSE